MAAAEQGRPHAEPRVRAGGQQVRAVLARRRRGVHDLRGRRTQGRPRQVSADQILDTFRIRTGVLTSTVYMSMEAKLSEG